MMRRAPYQLLTALSLIVWLAAGAVQAETKYTDGVVAVVNSQVITVYDVGLFALQGEQVIRSRYSAEDLKNEKVRSDMNAEIEALRKDAARQLIDQLLIHTEFTGKGYQVPDEFVDKRIDAIIASQFGGNWSKFEDNLEENETTSDEFRETMTRRLAVQMLTGQEVDRKVTITPEQVRQYWLEHQNEFTRPAKARLAMLEVRHSRHKDHAERVEAIVAGLASGKSFADLAADASDGANRSGGGDIGWQEVGNLRPEFREGLKDFKVDTVTAPITVSGSTYFLKVLESEQVAPPTFDQLRSKLEDELYRRERTRRYQQWVDALRQKAYVRIFFKD